MEKRTIELTAEEAEALKEVLAYRAALRDGLSPAEAAVQTKVVIAFPKEWKKE